MDPLVLEKETARLVKEAISRTTSCSLLGKTEESPASFPIMQDYATVHDHASMITEALT